jgi:hypothetical protein
MISLAEAPKVIEKIGHESGADKNFMHKRNGIYYLSYGSFYATSGSIYGPFTYQGVVGTGWWLDGYAHGSFIEHNGQWFHVWTRYFNREKNKVRENLMTYVHYTDDGKIVDDTDYLDAHYYTGVGQYDASWDKIEAEWYMASFGNQKKECPEGGFEVQDCGHDDYLYYPELTNFPENAKVTFRLSSNNNNFGKQIEIREGSVNGKLLGSCEVPFTGGWDKYQTVSCPLINIAGVKNIYLVFKGDDSNVLHLNWFKFNRTKNK